MYRRNHERKRSHYKVIKYLLDFKMKMRIRNKNLNKKITWFYNRNKQVINYRILYKIIKKMKMNVNSIYFRKKNFRWKKLKD